MSKYDLIINEPIPDPVGDSYTWTNNREYPVRIISVTGRISATGDTHLQLFAYDAQQKIYFRSCNTNVVPALSDQFYAFIDGMPICEEIDDYSANPYKLVQGGTLVMPLANLVLKPGDIFQVNDNAGGATYTGAVVRYEPLIESVLQGMIDSFIGKFGI